MVAYAHPVFGDKPVAEITTDDVLRALDPIWRGKPETATRVRGRVEQVLSYATVRGWRPNTLPNPAIWRGHLALLVPARQKVRATEHHAALNWRRAPAFMAMLAAQPGMGALALAFAILTAARSGEVRLATWMS